ncbi:class I SAM-dependent methyltransferase [Microbulbifer sp.]|uniref:class I SAM-dependent methyltransferase n=1 Tax=Microbulbifer sp. TaxID=1908541 RepID=UPI003F2C8579
MNTLLSQLLQQDPGETLWIADENSKVLLLEGFTFAGDLLSNRWDIARLAEDRVRRSYFNDFRFEELERRYRHIVYPVSKEKAVVHHIINCTPDALIEGGELILLGGKQSGIKTYAARAAQRFAGGKSLQKHGTNYSSTNIRPGETATGTLLDDQDYSRLRQPETLNGLYSKPGLFGWDKIDTGSALLAQQCKRYPPADNARVVDLGCGYGYLCAQLSTLGNYQFTATDNNAAALLACTKNFQGLGLQGTVTPSNAGDELEVDIADYLICNPPFHQGFQVEGDLTDRFLEQAARLLKPTGQALFVVNEFIPLGKKAAACFIEAELIARDKGFCVYHLRGPGRSSSGFHT